MLINGLRLVALDDNSYSVTDSCRTLGGVVRYWIPSDDGRGLVKRFRAFGGDFLSLGEALAEFLKIRGVRPLDAAGNLT